MFAFSKDDMPCWARGAVRDVYHLMGVGDGIVKSVLVAAFFCTFCKSNLSFHPFFSQDNYLDVTWFLAASP